MSPPPATAAATSRTRRRATHGSRIPRRMSGPTHPARPRAVVSGGAVALPRSVGAPPPWRRLARRAATIPDHRLLQRLVGGSAWIVIVGFALIGIVFMQVTLLKLNAGIGQSVERAATLDRQNAELRAAVSRLGSNDRIQAEAQRLGLVAPPAGSVTFLGKNGKRVGGDAPVAMATGTAEKPEAAGTGQGATAPSTAAPAPTPQATTAAQPAPAPTPQSTTSSASTPPPAAAPAATGTAAGGATPVASQP